MKFLLAVISLCAVTSASADIFKSIVKVHQAICGPYSSPSPFPTVNLKRLKNQRDTLGARLPGNVFVTFKSSTPGFGRVDHLLTIRHGKLSNFQKVDTDVFATNPKRGVAHIELTSTISGQAFRCRVKVDTMKRH